MKNIGWKGFFINLMGVILGISLTFGVNSLWQKREEKKKTKELLILVRNELVTNREWFKNQEKVIKGDIYVYKKILETNRNWNTIPIDTLNAYLMRTIYMEISPLTTSAWQIFQNSELIQKITDKELIIRLTDCYFWINEIQKHLMTQYWDIKIKSIPYEVDTYKYFDATMNNKEIVFFYTMTTTNDIIWNIFPLIDAIIEFNINMLDKNGNYFYDMDEKDKVFESFIEAKVDSAFQKRNGN